VRTESTRRRFISAAGLTGLTGLGLSSGAAAAQRHAPAVDTSDPLEFFGRHQAGIATPTQEHLQFAIFHPGRFGLAHRRPRPLVTLPSFSGDALQSRLCGGDIGLQVCAEDPQVAFHAVHNVIRLASPVGTTRWLLAGFGRTANSRRQATPRNLMGFKAGTNNIMVEDGRELDDFVWAGAPDSPTWMHGGSYMVVRRIAMHLGRWDDTGLDQQEQTFGRHKISGAPLGEVHEHDPLDLAARKNGRPAIPTGSSSRYSVVWP
jgi:deferrochelatase/peroxidase EfeB